eukprot:6555001-Prymnesium_polylepis.1
MLAACSDDGELARDCEAFSFHAMRAWAFKPVETRSCAAHLAVLGMETTHPKIAEVVKKISFFNWLGNDGGPLIGVVEAGRSSFGRAAC